MLPPQRVQQCRGPKPGGEALLTVHKNLITTGHHTLNLYLDLAVHHGPAHTPAFNECACWRKYSIADMIICCSEATTILCHSAPPARLHLNFALKYDPADTARQSRQMIARREDCSMVRSSESIRNLAPHGHARSIIISTLLFIMGPHTKLDICRYVGARERLLSD